MFVGERNPQGLEPLCLRPRNGAGDRLRKILLLEDLSGFDKVNLCQDFWNLREARRTAQKIVAERLILLGEKVCDAFRCRFLPFEVVSANGRRALVLPHPSGRCRIWNYPGAATKARMAVQLFAPETEPIQTFLPDPDFATSASMLDPVRLRNQRREVLALLSTESNHPASKMWRGYRDALVEYGVAICKEIMARGWRDNSLQKILAYGSGAPAKMPPWLGDARFHASHRSNLLRKDPVWYYQFGWSERDDLPYAWPAKPLGKFDL